ncbi:MAG: TrmJ/YjtD family RNA methyltransferase [Spirochaetales bacterium]|nr:TrmJ/YjtD family RNA methyltransferase [Spirochaetales bacterium]
MKELNHIRVILENPKQSKNVGSVCRAMKNMGLTRLYIAGQTQVDLDAARVTAIHAADLLETAVYCDSVEEALAGTVFSAALSRRRGKKRKYFSLYPEELAKKVLSIKKGDVALLFGNEVSGLSDADMDLCNVAVKIPVNEEFPSLNLSHAVQVVSYEIFKALSADREGHRPEGYTPINREELRELTGSITQNLKTIGFFTKGDTEETSDYFRDIFARASLSRREADRMTLVFTKIRGLNQANHP